MFGNPLLLADDGYQISRSVRLRSSASAYFNRTPGSASSQTTWTWSGWAKRGALANVTLFSAGQAGTQNYATLQLSSDQLVFDCISAGPVVVGRRYSTAVYRDPSAWYHVVAVWDTTNATAANRMRLYINGQQVTSFSLSTDPSLNATTFVNSTNVHQIGQFNSAGAYFDGYLTDINFIDGQALTPSSFGETDAITGVWKPKKYTGTYGTNGFFLNFSDNSSNTATTIGKDYSGNGNNWTPNNISVTAGSTYDSMLDVPTLWADGGNGRGNYATFNPLRNGQFNPTLSEGNLKTTSGGTAGGYMAVATIGVTSGKWYFESTCTLNEATYIYPIIGIGNIADVNGAPGSNAYDAGYWSNGSKYVNGATTAYGASWTTNDVIGVAFDLDSSQRTVEFFKNGVSQGVINVTTDTSISLAPKIGVQGTNEAMAINFGQRPFTYTPPTGFKALNTQNLPQPTIPNGASYMNVSLWSGDNAVSRDITGVAFNPDLIWVKQRNGTGVHLLFDTVRAGAQNLQSQSTAAEATASSLTAGGISAQATGGFTVVKGTSDSNFVNGTGGTYVGWQLKEGATQGFDIVTYTGNGVAGRTISHSLGVTPAMTIVKDRSNGTNGWPVWHRAYAGTQTLYLESTTGLLTRDRVTAVSSTTFTVGSHTEVNNNGNTYVAYLFSEVAGFSRFGSYTGNGSADGPFVFCGFRPRWIMFKKTNGTSNWSILDTARDDFNVADNPLLPNLSNAESTSTSTSGAFADILSNGFKARGNSGDINDSGATYIYAAFAENPFKYALAR